MPISRAAIHYAIIVYGQANESDTLLRPDPYAGGRN
jgi:hypothetical protein